MSKVYLLLRNNQQTGPYNLEELIQFDLKPFDLIWIEGKSAGWYYPQEIKALHPYLPFVKTVPQAAATEADRNRADGTMEKTQSKKVFVSMPASGVKGTLVSVDPYQHNPVHTKDNPLASPHSILDEKDDIKTTYTKTVEEVEAHYTNWIYQKKTKKRPAVSRKGIVAACFVVGVALAGWWAVNAFSNSAGTSKSEDAAFSPAPDEIITDTVSETSFPKPLLAVVKTKNQKKATSTSKKPSTVEILPTPDTKVQPNGSEGASIANKSYEHPPVGKDENESVVEDKKPEPVTAEAPKENKKKLKEKFLDLFKKKTDDKKNEEAKPTQEEDGERRSVRRESGSNLANLVSVRFDIPNDWMLGIKGAKATLTNRSSEPIVKATVEVVYYNDDNEVLDKKIISFSGIKSKQTQTISVPDHRTATRLEYNIISALGAGEPFAKM